MSDRLSQLQDQVNFLAELLCNATGLLQEHAQPSKFENFAESLSRGYEENDKNSGSLNAAKQQQQGLAGLGSVDEIKLHFARLITSTAKEIDVLIDSLPNEDESNEELQMKQLRDLEVENAQAAQQLEQVTQCAEHLLGQIQKKIAQIAESQLSAHREFNEASKETSSSK